MPKVSVIIPTYNRPQLLKRAVESVLAQSYADYEMLIVQNGTVEHSKELAEQLVSQGAPIRYIYEPVASGANARNVGIQNAWGEYIAFLDDDDEWLPSKLEKQVEVLNQNSKIELVACHAAVVNGKEETLDIRRARFDGELTVKTLLLNGCLIHTLSCILLRKKCFNMVGLFDTSLAIANDYDLYFRIAVISDMAMIKEPLIKYHVHGANAVKDQVMTVTENIRVMRSVQPSKELGVTRKMIRCAARRGVKGLARVYYSLGAESLQVKAFRQALGYFGAAIRYDPFVGLRVSWSKYGNPLYRLIKPYAAILQSAYLTLVSGSFQK